MTDHFRALDLFGGQGGAAKGYIDAGFTSVTGIDVNPQPRYPFVFLQDDAIDFLTRMIRTGMIELYDFIHASPPCQAYVGLANKDGRHPELIEPIRELLIESGKPYVIENVPGAPLLEPVKLCGSMFGLHVRRHRHFENNLGLGCSLRCDHKGQGVIRAYYGKPGHIAWMPKSDNVQKKGRRPLYRGSVSQAPEDMGIDWMDWDGLRESIPPAYTEYLGRQVLQHLRSGNAP